MLNRIAELHVCESSTGRFKAREVDE